MMSSQSTVFELSGINEISGSCWSHLSSALSSTEPMLISPQARLRRISAKTSILWPSLPSPEDVFYPLPLSFARTIPWIHDKCRRASLHDNRRPREGWRARRSLKLRCFRSLQYLPKFRHAGLACRSQAFKWGYREKHR